MDFFKFFFRVTMPTLSGDVYVHDISNTPAIKYAKILLIIPLIAVIISMFSDASNKLLFVVLQTISVLCLFFAYFYFSKLSLRRRVFNLYVVYFLVSIPSLISTYIIDIPEAALESPEELANLVINFGTPAIMCASMYVFVLMIVSIYTAWHIFKELSFITNQPYFFKSAKMLMLTIMLTFVGAILAVCLIPIHDEIGGMIFVITMILALVGIVLWLVYYVIAIFKIRQIVSYGEAAQNTVS